MARLEWAILCRLAFRDEGNSACLIGIFNRLFAKRAPVTHPHCSIFVRSIGRAGESIAIQIELWGPRNKKIQKLEQQGVAGENGEGNFIFHWFNMELPEFGKYEIRVIINGKHEKTLRFDLASQS